MPGGNRNKRKYQLPNGSRKYYIIGQEPEGAILVTNINPTPLITVDTYTDLKLEIIWQSNIIKTFEKKFKLAGVAFVTEHVDQSSDLITIKDQQTKIIKAYYEKFMKIKTDK